MGSMWPSLLLLGLFSGSLGDDTQQLASLSSSTTADGSVAWTHVGSNGAYASMCRLGNGPGVANLDYFALSVSSAAECQSACAGETLCKAVETSASGDTCRLWHTLPSHTDSGLLSCMRKLPVAHSTAISGDNHFGQLGLGFTASQDTLRQLPDLPDFHMLAAGAYHTVVLGNDHSAVSTSVYTFGGNSNGQLGTGNYVARATPQLLEFNEGISQVAAGGAHTILITSEGDAYSFGRNSHGQLCNSGHGGSNSLPIKIAGLTDIRTAAAGWAHTLFLKVDGTVLACGDNSEGQLGLGDTRDRAAPTLIPGIANVKAVVAGAKHTLILTMDGVVHSFGSNQHGQLGRQTHAQLTPQPITTLPGPVKRIAAGDYHSLFMVQVSATPRSHRAYACGMNLYGQLGLGQGSSKEVPLPIEVPGIPAVEQVAAGSGHSLFLTADHKVYGTGRNYDGQLAVHDRQDSDRAREMQLKFTPSAIFAGGGVSAVTRSS